MASLLQTVFKTGTVLFILVGLFLYDVYFMGRKTVSSSRETNLSHLIRSRAFEQNNDSLAPIEDCDDIYLHEDRCQFVARNCEKLGFFDYLYLHYCVLAHVPILSFAILILLLLFYFYLLGSTAERFFCPVLARISRVLNLSPNVAGVTLLALGNGSPDIFSQIAAVNNGVFETALGTMLGSSLFVGTVVVGAITLAANTVVVVTRRPFIRDVVFYMIAIVFLFCVCWSNKFYLWEGAALLSYYLFYVIVVIAGRLIHQWSKRQHKSPIAAKEEAPLLLNDADQTTDNNTSINTNGSNVLTEENSSHSFPTNNNEIHSDFESASESTSTTIPLSDEVLASALGLEDQNARVNQRMRKMSTTLATKLFRKVRGGVIYLAKYGIFGAQRRKPHVVNKFPEDEDFDTFLQKRRPMKEKFKYWLQSGWRNLAEFFDWNEQSTRSKILTIVDSPRLLVQHCTIHYAEEDKYFRPFLILQPICIPLFFFLVFDAWTVSWFFPGPLWVWILSFGIIVALIVLMTTKSSEPPAYEWVYIVTGMVMAVTWIYLVASELVSLIWSLGKILGISNAIMGLTIIAWGNSVGDAVSNVIVSRKGHPQMAISACIAAPLTNLLLGMGSSSLILTIRNGGEFDLNPKNQDVTYLTNNMFLAFIFIMFTLILIITLVPLFKFRYTKQMGIVLILNYVAFTTLSFLSEFGLLFENKIIWFDH